MSQPRPLTGKYSSWKREIWYIVFEREPRGMRLTLAGQPRPESAGGLSDAEQSAGLGPVRA